MYKDACREAIVQQRHLNKRVVVCDNEHIKLLSYDTSVPTWIYTSQVEGHSRYNHQGIQLKRQSNQRWIHTLLQIVGCMVCRSPDC